MKKYIHIVCAVLMGVFASCSQSEIGDETPQSKQTILKVVATDGLQTRAAATGVDRFAIEIYTDDAYTTPANVFGSGNAATNKASNATGEFAMVLDRTQKYYCLLWADKSASSVYNIGDLKAVTLTGKAAEAWHGTKEIAAGTEAALTATLNRAVSKISLLETKKLPAGGTLTLNLSQPTTFNVVDGTTGTPSARPEETITIAAAVDGSTTPVKLNTTDIFVLSSVATANLTDLTFKYGTEDAFTVPQAPLKANYNTNIKGHYSTAKDGVTFTVTCNGEWGTPDNEPASSLKVGDWYPAGATKANAVGVVFEITNEGANGKIVSMDETEGVWSTAQSWQSSKALPSGMTWACPSEGELHTLYTAWNGDDTSTANATARAAFNAKLATAISADNYWTNFYNNTIGGWYVNFNTNSSDYSPLSTTYKIRAIASF